MTDGPTGSAPSVFGFQRFDPLDVSGLRYALLGRSGATGTPGGDPQVFPQQVYPRLCYLPLQHPHKPYSHGSFLSLDDSWSEGGLYLVFDALPQPSEQLTDALWKRLSAEVGGKVGGFGNSRLFWITTAGSAPEEWQISYVPMMMAGPQDPAGETNGTRHEPGPPSPVLTMKNLQLVFPDSCRLDLDSEARALTIRPPPDRFITLVATPGTDGEAERVGEFRGDVAAGVHLMFTGANTAGCLWFDLEVEADSSRASPAEQLDIGCRFFFPSGTSDSSVTELRSTRYPIFAVPPGGLSLRANMDPFQLLNSERSYFSFNDTESPIPSHYRTTLGYGLALTPGPGSKLVFAMRPTAAAGRPNDPVYLVPAGPFRLMVMNPSSAPQPPDAKTFLCGLSGTEYFALRGSTLFFVPGQPACAMGFTPAGRAARAGDVGLSGEATTSWVGITALAETCYYAQAHTASLYGGASSVQLPLPYYPVPAAWLPSVPYPPFPSVPYAGVRATDLGIYRGLEEDVLSHVRRQAIANAAVDPPSGGGKDLETAITPSGLLAEFAEEGTWKKLTLAYRPGSDNQLAFTAPTGIVGALRAALLSDRQFIVIADSAAAQALKECSEISIDDWKFSVNPDQWSLHGTVMIIKHVRGKSVAELVQNTGAWTQKDALSGSVDETQATLQRIIDEAAPGATANNSQLTDFWTTVNDPTWDGILFLNCVVPLTTGLPPELAGLAAGIDTADFYAHHLGVNHNVIHHELPLTLKDSSLFGLIDYPPRGTHPSIGTSSQQAFDFTVRSLRVRFANSTVVSFSSEIDLTVRRLFGVPVSSATGNVITLHGALQRHGSHDAYVFSSSARHVFTPVTGAASPNLQSVTIDGAQYMTIAPTTQRSTPSAKNDPEIVSRFAFKGDLGFSALNPNGGGVLDLFSYESLPYSNLAVDMSFPANQPTQRQFTLDASKMTVDAANGVVRSKSLVAELPLSHLSFVVGGSGDTLKTLGYTTVQLYDGTQLVAATGPGSSWLGLQFDLKLGSLGALASGHALVAQLLLAWAPGGPPEALELGIKLPGVPGGMDGFSLESVLKVGVAQIALLHSDESYAITLQGVGLNFLGMRIPPGAAIDLTIFGDPSGGSGTPVVGWYGAYVPPPSVTSSMRSQREQPQQGGAT